MKARLSGAVRAVVTVLTSKEARGPEMALARLVLVALGAKLGVDFVHFLG